MRAKTETRRQAILDAAAVVFQEMGFERTTMAAICARLGYSKATLYNYFASKEELFSVMVFEATEAEFQATLAALDATLPDITAALQQFGQRLLALLYSPPVQAVRRLTVAEAGRSALGRQCYELGPVRSEAATAVFLQRAMDAGQLRQANARVAALHLRGLLEAEWLDRFLCQMLESVSPAEIEASVRRAVAAFMAAYGPLENQAGKKPSTDK
ncbi:MAG: TetR/AcrR family transcriptional regulator [Giesbergeria sp.]|uniref:TetR/AcrR family transcriptional regulator n=1 Tax=Giesbergeria sp. TaxID=2818473 RepID=UPI00261F1B88|nr:TetR/AcrR family transcriptional regulator [Giesbergeria sp.]MDD2608066.1 TetR/AcrR family transcriptional regulator [Giesbergeria sp.]